MSRYNTIIDYQFLLQLDSEEKVRGWVQSATSSEDLNAFRELKAEFGLRIIAEEANMKLLNNSMVRRITYEPSALAALSARTDMTTGVAECLISELEGSVTRGSPEDRLPLVFSAFDRNGHWPVSKEKVMEQLRNLMREGKRKDERERFVLPLMYFWFELTEEDLRLAYELKCDATYVVARLIAHPKWPKDLFLDICHKSLKRDRRLVLLARHPVANVIPEVKEYLWKSGDPMTLASLFPVLELWEQIVAGDELIRAGEGDAVSFLEEIQKLGDIEKLDRSVISMFLRAESREVRMAAQQALAEVGVSLEGYRRRENSDRVKGRTHA